jgi:peptide/nickel transport system substrate-binding protein
MTRLGIAALVLLLGIGHSDSVSGATHGTKVFRYALENPETSFDPAEVSDFTTSGVIANIFDAPLGYDYLARPVKLVPNTLTEMPEITEGGRVYTLRVRPGIYFQIPPGQEDVFRGRKRELNAHDYAYSIKRIFDPRKRSPNLFRVEGNIAGMDELLARARKENRFDYEAPLDGLRVLDDFTLQIRLKEPDYNFIHYLTFCTLSCAVAREVVEFYGEKTGEHPVGTGPYMLTFWKRRSKMVFEANPSYREEYFAGAPARGDNLHESILAANKGKRLPIAGKVEVSVIEEHQPRYLAFLNGEFDLLYGLPNEFATVAIPNDKLAPNLANRGIRMQRTPGNDITYSYFRMTDPIVGGYEPEKIALRRAIVLAQDVEEEIRIARKNQAIQAYSPVAPPSLGYDAEFRSTATEYNPAKARALLDMYGYVDCDGDGFRDLPRESLSDACKSLTIEYASLANAEQKAYDENWKRNMDAIGIRMTFKKMPNPDLIKASRLGQLQMCWFGLRSPLTDALAFFALLYGPNAGQANHARFKSGEFDKLYEAARRLPDSPERNAIYREMNRLFLVYAPWRLGVHHINTDLSQPWLIGYSRHPAATDFWKYVDVDSRK